MKNISHRSCRDQNTHFVCQ